MVTAGTLRTLLNQLRWDATADAEGVLLVVRVRHGVEAHEEEVPFTDIVDILAAGVTSAEGAFLPYHRVVAVRRRDEVLWRSPS
jgi:uncharacterized protein (UPF0248 family)